MAIMGLRINDSGGGLDASIGDTLAKALFGDPEAAIRSARLESDLEAQQYQNRQMAAATAYSQAQADREAWELNQRATNLPTFQDYYGGLVEAPVPVTVEGALPAPAPDLPAPDLPEPIPVEAIPLPLPGYAFSEGAPSLRFPVGGQPEITAAAEPIPVDFETGPALMADEDTIQLPQPDELPGEVIPVTPEQQAAYERDVAAKRAQAALIIGGGGNAAQMAQGLGIGEGIVKSGSSDPAVRAQAALLYANKTAGEGGTDMAKLAEPLRKEYLALPAVKNFEEAYATLQGVEQAAKDNTGASDVAFMYGVMKAFDPGVAVQEGDKANAQATMNIPARVALMYNNAVDGKTDLFTPQVRAEFVQAVRGQVQGRRAQAERWMQQYTEKAKQQGVPPEWVVFDVPEMGEAPDLSQQLPPGVNESQVEQTMANNPNYSREQAVKLLLARLKKQQEGGQ